MSIAETEKLLIRAVSKIELESRRHCDISNQIMCELIPLHLTIITCIVKFSLDLSVTEQHLSIQCGDIRDFMMHCIIS